MEFRKFRQGGELSDVEVSINGATHKLHRFPLYTRSDFFLKELSKIGSQSAELTLDDFPGGSEIFQLVADFCYNIKVEITWENVIGLRCGAKYLEMNGSENLYERTGVFIQGVISETKRGKNIVNLLKILSTLPPYRNQGEGEKMLEDSVVAVTYHWNKCQYGTLAVDEVTSKEVQDILFSMNFDLFVCFMAKCKELLESSEVLNIILSDYIGHHLTPEADLHNDKPDDEKSTEENGEAVSDITPQFSEESLNLVKILLEKVQPNLSRSAAAKWLKPLLAAYARVDGSNELLGEIAASMANQIDRECLASMNEETLVHFAQRVKQEDLQDQTISVITDHILEESTQGMVTAKGFSQLVKLLPITKLACHDNLLQIVGQLLTRESELEASQKEELLSVVLMDRCTVKGLRVAASSGGIPAAQLTEAALVLCEQYHEKLEATTRIIQEQEREISAMSIQTFGMNRTTDSPYYTPRKSYASSRSASHSSTAVPKIEVSSPLMQDSPTAGLGRLLDSMWYDGNTTPPNLYESNTKLSELLRKQRQARK